jgi:hypothetical protein
MTKASEQPVTPERSFTLHARPLRIDGDKRGFLFASSCTTPTPTLWSNSSTSATRRASTALLDALPVLARNQLGAAIEREVVERPLDRDEQPVLKPIRYIR